MNEYFLPILNQPKFATYITNIDPDFFLFDMMVNDLEIKPTPVPSRIGVNSQMNIVLIL